MRPQLEANTGLSTVLRGVVADMQHASGAEIVSIFLDEEATHTYYAPFATGQPQESLLDSLADMREQGKVPDELGIHQYASTVWLNQRVRELEAMAVDLLARGEWTGYAVGTRPSFEAVTKQPLQQAIGTTR